MNGKDLKLLLASVSVVFLLAEASAKPIASVEYFYAADGTLTGRAVNGKLQQYQYDKKGQLVAVVDALSRRMVEHYVYDPAGNILSKTVNEKTTTYIYDKANQLISSACEGKVTKYQYDAAGRMVKEGEKSYCYGYKDKILEIQENGRQVAAFNYHMDGQIASAMYGDKSEDFLWDGLALIHRGATNFINEPYVTGGNPILSSKDGVMFNDMLGSTLNIGGKSVNMTAFGESADTNAMYTGKPYIGELGYAFLFRNYRSDYGKWQTTDPLGYPDGWNNLAYCNNGVVEFFDKLGGQVNYTWSGWSISRIVGTGGGLISSGIQGGYSVLVIWKSIIYWECSGCSESCTCSKKGSKEFYNSTTYSVDSNGIDAPVWTARSSQMVTITADNILAALGIPTDALSIAQVLIDKTVAANLSSSRVDSKALRQQPKRPTNPSHLCE